MVRYGLIIVALLGAGACTSSGIPTEGDQIVVGLPDLHSMTNVSHRATMPVLLGSGTETTFTPRQGPATCFRAQVEGAQWSPGSSLLFDVPGDVSLVFEPTGCPELPDAETDRLTLRTVAASEGLSARFALPGIEYGLRMLDRDDARLGQPAEVPEGLVPRSGGTLLVVAGVPTQLDVVLSTEDDLVLIGPGAGALDIQGDAIFSPRSPASGTFLAPSVGSGEIRFEAQGASIPVGRWEAIDRRDVRRLRAGTVFDRQDEGGEWTAGVAVWGEDRQGRRIHGLPLEIEVRRGPLQLPETGSLGPWLFQPSLCTPPWELVGEVVERRLRMRFDRRRIDVDLAFDMTDVIVSPAQMQADNVGWEPEEDCVDSGSNASSGCGCTSTGAGGLPGGLAVLFGLIGLWRRRSRAAAVQR